MKRVATIAALTLAVATGCATTNPDGTQEPNRTATGAIIGAVAGAVIGNQIDSHGGAAAGAIVGGAAGAAIGNQMDKQAAEFKQQLAQERAAHEVEVQQVRDNLLKLTLSNEVMFDFDRADIKPSFRPTLDKLANVLRKYNRTRVTVVGYTDSTGTEAYNQRLSERRAQAVVNYLASTGVDPYRLRAEGRGESNPRATNATEAGRQLNRRVEILVQPDNAQG